MRVWMKVTIGHHWLIGFVVSSISDSEVKSRRSNGRSSFVLVSAIFGIAAKTLAQEKVTVGYWDYTVSSPRYLR